MLSELPSTRMGLIFIYCTYICCQHSQQQTYYIAKLQILLSKPRQSVDFILKVKVKFTLEQTMKAREGGGGGVEVHLYSFFNFGAGWR
jgi:hypothetical protein